MVYSLGSESLKTLSRERSREGETIHSFGLLVLSRKILIIFLMSPSGMTPCNLFDFLKPTPQLSDTLVSALKSIFNIHFYLIKAVSPPEPQSPWRESIILNIK